MTRGAIHTDDLRVGFDTRRTGYVRAVDGVSLDVEPGEVFCIAGESGCGKTTLGRALLGLVAPSAGSISVDGVDPSRARGRKLRDFRRGVQIIFQDPMGSLNPRQTVYEIVAEGVRIHGLEGDETELVAAALSRVGLRPPERFFLAYPHELSGGQRQRVVVAAALVLRPRILVADEPVSMLDASVRGELTRLLMELKDELDMTLVVITHDLGFAWTIATRVGIMYLGRLVEVGSAQDVLLRPSHPYTQALLEVAPEVGVRGDQRLLEGEPPDPTNIPAGCRFRPRCPLYSSGLPHEIAEKCATMDPALMPTGAALAACHPAARTPAHP